MNTVSKARITRVTSASPKRQEAKNLPNPRKAASPNKFDDRATPSQKLAFFREMEEKLRRSPSPITNQSAQKDVTSRINRSQDNIQAQPGQEQIKTQIVKYGTKSPVEKPKVYHRNQKQSPDPVREPDFGMHHMRFSVMPAKSVIEQQKRQRKEAPSYVRQAHGSPSLEKEDPKVSMRRTVEFKPSPRSQMENDRKLLRPADRSNNVSPLRTVAEFRPSPRSQMENDRKYLLPADRGQNTSPLKATTYSRQMYNRSNLNEEAKTVKRRDVSPMESRNMKALLENQYAKLTDSKKRRPLSFSTTYTIKER